MEVDEEEEVTFLGEQAGAKGTAVPDDYGLLLKAFYEVIKEEVKGKEEREAEGEEEEEDPAEALQRKWDIYEGMIGEDEKYRFCPKCGNLLQVHPGRKKGTDAWRWKCMTCPYTLKIMQKVKYPAFIQNEEGEEEDGIVDTSKANEHRQKTEVLCPECDFNEAYFYQMQTRSADEPMTNFYECCNPKCKHSWRD